MIEIIKELEDMVNRLEFIKNKSEFVQIECEMSSFFEKVDEEILKELPSRSNIYFDSIYKVCQNLIFNESLYRVMSNSDANEELREDCEFIYVALRASVFPLLFFIPHIHPDTIIYMFKKTQTDLNFLKNYQKEQEVLYTIGDIRTKLLEIITDEQYEYREDSNKFVDLDSLFKNFRLSRLLITNILYSHHTGESLRIAFKNLMKNKKEMGEKFSLGIALHDIYKTCNNISFYNNSISGMYSTDFKDFFEQFQQNKNEKNASYIISKMAENFELCWNKKRN